MNKRKERKALAAYLKRKCQRTSALECKREEIHIIRWADGGVHSGSELNHCSIRLCIIVFVFVARTSRFNFIEKCKKTQDGNERYDIEPHLIGIEITLPNILVDICSQKKSVRAYAEKALYACCRLKLRVRLRSQRSVICLI